MARIDDLGDFSSWELGEEVPTWASLSDPERKQLSLRRLEHLVALRDTQRGVARRDQQAFINRAIRSVFRDCNHLGLTREACALLGQEQPAAWPD